MFDNQRGWLNIVDIAWLDSNQQIIWKITVLPVNRLRLLGSQPGVRSQPPVQLLRYKNNLELWGFGGIHYSSFPLILVQANLKTFILFLFWQNVGKVCYPNTPLWASQCVVEVNNMVLTLYNGVRGRYQHQHYIDKHFHPGIKQCVQVTC